MNSTELFFIIEDCQIGPGQSVRMTCPFCKGGKNEERNTFGVYRVEDTTKHKDGYFFKCYRASCTDSNGFLAIGSKHDSIFVNPTSIRDDVKPANFAGFHYPNPTTTLDEVWMEGLGGMYPLLSRDVMYQMGVKLIDEAPYEELVVPLNTSKRGFEAGGYTIRNMWPGGDKRTYWAPHMQKRGSGAWFCPRTNESNNFEESVSVYRTEACSVVTVVEDALSALVVGRYAPTYCLLGTHLGGAALVDLTQGIDAVLLYLDPDTWDVVPGQRFPAIISIINKLAPRVTVIPRMLDRDPKYLDDIPETLFEDHMKAYKSYGVFRGQ